MWMKREMYHAKIAVEVTRGLFHTSERETLGLCELYLAHAVAIGKWAEVSGKQVEVAEHFGAS
jgi:hypothetical protein